MFTAPFERFVLPARSFPQIWRLVAGIIVILAVYFASIFLLFVVIWAAAGTLGMQSWAAKLIEASTPTGTMLLFASFIGLAIAPMVAVKLLHKRPASTLFGPHVIVLRDFVGTATTVLLIYAVFTLGWSLYFDAIPNLDLFLWLCFLPLALLGVLVQTGAEELIFRGYLQQQLAARFRSPLLWMVLPSLVFGLVHYDPTTAGTNVWLIVVSATIFGLIAADLTRVTGTIGASWGFHFANNVVAVLFISVQGTIPGLALYLTPYAADDTTHLSALILVDFVGLIIAWRIVRWVLSR